LFDEIGTTTNEIEERANKFAEFILLGNASPIGKLQ
jgi:Zn-dependent peptidase ImmA (M78 family)